MWLALLLVDDIRRCFDVITMQLAVSDIPAASAPITEMELETVFAVAVESDAEVFLDMVDGDLVQAEWSSSSVRGRFFTALRSAGCGKRMIDGVAYFTFTDGSAVIVSRLGLDCY